jgi:arsenate reductase (thioredoxin)
MKESSVKGKVLFYCRCNALWSQMAEAFVKRFFPERYDAYSAGARVTAVHPDAVRVMAEIGIDLSRHRSKAIEEFVGTRFDCVALVCGEPPEVCPFFPQQEKATKCERCASCCVFLPFFPRGVRVMRVTFKDPTKSVGSENESLELFRQVRNEVRDWVMDTFGATDASTVSQPGGAAFR